MKRADPRLAAYGATAILIGIGVALWVDQPVIRLVGSITAIAIGFGLVRQAFRLE